ncbi:alanine--tRNA ligase [Candidatus Saganbacteria bacterium]|nr:alanine--tRNA ligase [Candidatus Saganbacteria bacterium]
MKSSEIREQFLEFFEKKGHKRQPSASLIPSDPTVLLTLAGMLPFKPIFLGTESPKYKRVTTVQKCIRMNDIGHVGKTTRHHTFFEMLGNFSFGDYFKEDAIAYAWELLTEAYKIEKEKLVIAIYEKDDEAYDIWNKKIGIPKEKIYRLDEENNFWSAGPTGPCGPCSEIYYDSGVKCDKPDCNPACDCERFLEIWNLVFIQYNRNEAGELKPLPKKNIDTGMGLERISRVLQGKTDNFDTDLFTPIFEKLPDRSASSKIIADHLRAMTYLISDSVLPSNEGRGYVLRRIIRRAILNGRKLKMQMPFLSELSRTVIEQGKGTYPELATQSKIIEETIRSEEIGFNNTLESGMKLLEELFAKHATDKKLAGIDVFKLHDTFGFPYEITEEFAIERGYSINKAEFENLMGEQRERARAGAFKLEDSILRLKNTFEEKHGKTNFVGYDKLESDAKILEIIPDENIVILDKTPFYPEGGGQIGDTGIINESIVIGTYGEIGGVILHRLDNIDRLKIGDHVHAKVDESKRKNIMAHHTGTHLLHAALRKTLGDMAKQAGSYVGPDRLRFDFSFNRAMTKQETAEVERIVNENIKKAIKVEKFETNLNEAKKLGAMALFSEKYGDKVRVVKIGDLSLELCGGCHVDNTKDIVFFKIIKEEALQSGVRRIEAIAGDLSKAAIVYKAKDLHIQIDDLMRHHAILQAKKQLLGGGAFLDEGIFEVDPTELNTLGQAVDEKDSIRVNKFLEHLEGRLEWARERNKNIQKEIDDLEAKKSLLEADSLLSQTEKIKDIVVLKASLIEVPVDNMRIMGDKLRDSLRSGIIILASTISDKISFLVIVTDDLVKKGYHAGKLAKVLAETCGGGGGGRPNKAEAGGRDISRIEEALKKAIELI